MPKKVKGDLNVEKRHYVGGAINVPDWSSSESYEEGDIVWDPIAFVTKIARFNVSPAPTIQSAFQTIQNSSPFFQSANLAYYDPPFPPGGDGQPNGWLWEQYDLYLEIEACGAGPTGDGCRFIPLGKGYEVMCWDKLQVMSSINHSFVTGAGATAPNNTVTMIRMEGPFPPVLIDVGTGGVPDGFSVVPQALTARYHNIESDAGATNGFGRVVEALGGGVSGTGGCGPGTEKHRRLNFHTSRFTGGSIPRLYFRSQDRSGGFCGNNLPAGGLYVNGTFYAKDVNHTFTFPSGTYGFHIMGEQGSDNENLLKISVGRV